MDAATIQSRVNRGMSIASRFLGVSTIVYRPDGPTSPIAPATIVTTLLASFNTSAKFDAVKPRDYPKPEFYGLFDRTLTLPGDYLVQGPQTWFIASQDLNQSTLCIQCNRTVSLVRPAIAPTTSAGFGATQRSGNGGAQRSNEPAYLTGWPASLLQGTKGNASAANLPDDVRSPWVAVLLPLLPTWITIGTTDQIEDDLGRVFTISSSELTALGWRLTAEYAGV
jgi:hypothetical protein